MNKKKMIYLMNVDWNWIKQRPHFLAEELTDYYDLTVVNQHRYSRKGFQKRAFIGNMVEIKAIPRIDRYRFLKNLNLIIKRRCLSKLIRNTEAEYIYTTFPDQIDWIPENYSGKVIYDCMDDHIGLSRTASRKHELEVKEKRLIARADYVFVSSGYLFEVLKNRYKDFAEKKSDVIRNGFGGDILNIDNETAGQRKNVLAYFGTISDWFDMNLVEKSLEDFPNLEYLLMGPLHNGVQIPSNNRIHYIGTVEHDQLYEKTKDACALIMPFILDESIKAVDPVKLYEYINFNRNIICVNYPEVQRFKEFACFYDDYEQYKDCIARVCNDTAPVYTMKQRTDFLKNNSWENRAQRINALLTEWSD